VPISETVRSFREILDGKHDEIPEGAFLLKGSIDDVVAQAGGGDGKKETEETDEDGAEDTKAQAEEDSEDDARSDEDTTEAESGDDDEPAARAAGDEK
jgi:hypothetical protein